jgi:serine protease AprX
VVVEPTWKRIGLTKPLEGNSGQGIGIIVLDEVIPHESLSHLKGRVKQVKVHKDLTITCTDVFGEPITKEVNEYTEHGLMVLNLLAHQPIEIRDNFYRGLAPSAHFIFLSANKPERRKKGLEWILQQDWNTKICLNLRVPQERGWMSPTHEDPNVQAMKPVLDAGLLVVTAGGNSKVHNNLHPKQYLVVGGFNDKGSSDQNRYEQHPSVSYGLNGDGHWRPDLLAPYTYLPLPSLRGKGFDYFGGTCGSSALVAGLCAYFMSTMPDLTPDDIRNVLTETADVLEGFPAPIINGERALNALKDGYRNNKPPSTDPLVKVTNENESIISENPLERALALTMLIKNEKLKREEIWKQTNDESPMVKKVAIQGLGDPVDQIEREKYWNKVHKESSEFGVREFWAYTLLSTTTKEELDKWMSLVEYRTIDIWICINLFLRKFYPDAPEMEISPDPDPKIMTTIVAPVLDWYKQSINSSV